MKVFAGAVLVLLALGSSSSVSNHVSPVQKVIQLIDDMAVKVQKDLDATNLEFEEFAKYCDDEASQKDFVIKKFEGAERSPSGINRRCSCKDQQSRGEGRRSFDQHWSIRGRARQSH